ncbi:MAG TPA: YdbH domain-containing protein, partial [Desulfurivibrionaceae bacterium]|nr:YdbH domain-containing protein [Desulfurivibrionaceae bacterium]
PLVVGRDGVQVAGGSIRAVAPGGTLELPAERLQVLARNNETMDLVVRALQNFNYSVLNSTIDYDQNGTLNLGLRLEGSNPQVRNGHPIVVNINLQEDIPALLTSLQLSGRVNEAVTERVRKLMEKREAGKTEK